jgi:hypothetical protein
MELALKHMKQLLFLMILLAGARAFGQANYTTGDELRENCKYAVSDSDGDHATARAGFCIGFIDGFQQFEQLVDISQGAQRCEFVRTTDLHPRWRDEPPER